MSSSTIIRMENDSFLREETIIQRVDSDSESDSEPTQNVNSFRPQVNLRVVHSRPAFSNLNSSRNIDANRNTRNFLSSSSFPSSLLSSSSSTSIMQNPTPRTPVRNSAQSEPSRSVKSPRTRYVQQCRSIATQLQLTPSSFKKHRLMRSPIVTSRTVAEERRRYQELLESVFNDSLEYGRTDDSTSESSFNQSTVSEKDSGNDSVTSPPIRKVAASSKINKARRRFRF